MGGGLKECACINRTQLWLCGKKQILRGTVCSDHLELHMISYDSGLGSTADTHEKKNTTAGDLLRDKAQHQTSVWAFILFPWARNVSLLKRLDRN